MGVWTWIREVIAEHGEHDPVPIHLERAEGGEYVFRLGVRAGFGGNEVARIPVERRVNQAPHPILKEIHHCEVAGQALEAANVYALRSKVARLLESIAPARALPVCEFRVPAMDYSLPVYEEGGRFNSPVLGGSTLKADDLAGIRADVCRYMISAGYVHDVDEVQVGVVRPRDLRLVAPAAVFRSQTDSGLWLPSVEGTSPEGPVVGLIGHATELRRPGFRPRRAGPEAEDAAPATPDVLALLRYLRSELGRAGSKAAPGVYATEVRPEIWAAAEARTEDAGTRLVAALTDDDATTLELAVRRTGAGDVAVAVAEHGISLFLAPDEDGLAKLVGRHLAGADFLRFAEEVEVQAAAAPRAERLPVEAIASAAPQDEPKEVHPVWS